MNITLPGINPAPRSCFCCLDTFVLSNDRTNTCLACKALLDHGVVLIGVKDDCPDYHDRSYRDGNFCVVTWEHAFNLGLITRRRSPAYATKYLFIPTKRWKELKLPQRGKSGANHTSRKGVSDAD